MSTEAVAATPMPASELAVSQRVQQLQALIEQAGQAASGQATPVTASATGRASCLRFELRRNASGRDHVLRHRGRLSRDRRSGTVEPL